MPESEQINQQSQLIEEAFALFIKVCCKDDDDLSLFLDSTPIDISPINECLASLEQKKILYDIDSIEKFDETIDLLKENKQYDSLTMVETDDELNLDYKRLFEIYRDFLKAYQFAKAWAMPKDIGKKDSEIAKNTIVYGAPGTGKSYFVKKLGKENKAEIIRTTFHPDMDYASFVGCYKPYKKDDDLTYEFVPQAFTKAYVNAWKNPDKKCYLIVEEINRGNCSQIFGDLFQLLDRDEKGFSLYDVDADTDLASHLSKEFANCSRLDMTEEVKSGRKIKLPCNLWLLATMNTSDQSLYPMDSAFKRRWEWKYIPLEKGVPDKYIIVDGSYFSWSVFLDKINTKIAEATQSEDKKLGFWFLDAPDNSISLDTFVNKVVFYLWYDIFKDRQYDDRSPFVLSGLKFHSFYKGYDINKYAVKHFLDVLEVQEVENPNITQSSNGSGSISGKDRFRVIYNRKPFDDTNATEVYKAVIESIGIDRVKSVSDQLKIKNKWIITVAEYDKLQDKDKKRYRELSKGIYLYTNLSNPQKKENLDRIRKELGLEEVMSEAEIVKG